MSLLLFLYLKLPAAAPDTSDLSFLSLTPSSPMVWLCNILKASLDFEFCGPLSIYYGWI